MNKQACEHCREVIQKFHIRSGIDLEKAIRMVAAHLSDGTLRESEYRPKGVPNYCDSGPFSELAKKLEQRGKWCSLAHGKVWGDIVDYYFECPECNQLYELSAETREGWGGNWHARNRE